MTTLQDQIAALPPYPADAHKIYANPDLEERKALAIVDAHAARLGLAREWIEAAKHRVSCDTNNYRRTADGRKLVFDLPCTCGRDALLKALEVPSC